MKERHKVRGIKLNRKSSKTLLKLVGDYSYVRSCLLQRITYFYNLFCNVLVTMEIRGFGVL